jgi:TonB family protein
MGRHFHVAAMVVAVALSISPVFSESQVSAEGTRKVVNRVTPQYPSVARSMNIRGTVKVEAVVNPNGTVKSVEVKGGHPMLAQSAQNAIREWKFEPSPRETREAIEIKFSPE